MKRKRVIDDVSFLEAEDPSPRLEELKKQFWEQIGKYNRAREKFEKAMEIEKIKEAIEEQFKANQKIIALKKDIKDEKEKIKSDS